MITKTTKKLSAVILSASLLLSSSVSVLAAAEPSSSGDTYTYYFLAPDNYFKTESGAANSSVGAYWWQPSEPAYWPGVEMTPAPEIHENAFKIEVSEKTATIIFNAFVDAGTPADPALAAAAHQTVNINTEGYEDDCPYDENLNTDNFDGWIYVLDLIGERSVNELSGAVTKGGAWFTLDDYKNYSNYYGTYDFTEIETGDTPIGTQTETDDAPVGTQTGTDDTPIDTPTDTDSAADETSDVDTETDVGTDDSTDTNKPVSDKYTYYFLAPDNYFKLESGAASSSVGAYWWQPSEPAPWPGVEMTPAPEIHENAFKIEVSEKTATIIIFNAFVDAGTPADPALAAAAHQTIDINTEGYEYDCPYDESVITDNFDGWIYVLNMNYKTVNELSGAETTRGAWFTLDDYKNYSNYYGTYNLTETETDDAPIDTQTDTDSAADETSDVDTQADTDSAADETSDVDTQADTDSAADETSDVDTQADTDSAADETSDTDAQAETDSDNSTDSDYSDNKHTIFFYNDNWDSKDKVNFYIWAVDENGNQLYGSKNGWVSDGNWGLKAIRGQAVEGQEHLWESYEFDILDGYTTYVIFHNAATNEQTFDCVLTEAAYGDTARLTGEVAENPVDSEKIALIVAFDRSGLTAPITITSTGNVVGSTRLPNVDYNNTIAEFIYNNFGYTDKAGNEVVTAEKIANILRVFNVSPDTVKTAFVQLNDEYGIMDYIKDDVIKMLESLTDTPDDPIETRDVPTDTDSSTDDAHTDTDKSDETPDKPDDPSEPKTYGDIDNDTRITSNDALLVLRRSLKIDEFTEAQDKCADVDNDGRITSNDALMILRYSLKMSSTDLIGESVA